jgi:Sulfotransferase family
MLPNFFVIGAAKCGTTSLTLYLDAHPEVHVSAIAEPRFFAAPDPARPFPGRRIGDLGDYEALFDSEAPMRGEVCGAYSQHPWRPGVPERIRELVPDARFVYLVGDPIRRVESHYVQTLAEEGETRTIDAVIGDIEQPENPVVCPGRYAQQAKRYLDTFGDGRMLIVDQDELLHERRATLSAIFSFLGVERDYRSATFDQQRNRGSEHRRLSSGIYGRLRETRVRGALAAAPRPVRQALLKPVRMALTEKVARAPLQALARSRLEEHFRPEVEWLRSHTGKQFAGWSI